MVRGVGVHTIYIILLYSIIAQSGVALGQSSFNYRPELNFSIQEKTSPYINQNDIILLEPTKNGNKVETSHIASIYQKQLNWSKSRDMADSWGSLLIKSDPKLMDDIMRIEYQMSYGAKNEIDYLSANREYDLHMYNLKMHGEIMDVEYGANFKSFDKEYEKMLIVGKSKDKPGQMFWLKKTFSFLSIKTFLSNSTDTVNFDSNRPRTNSNQIGSTLELTIKNLPIISLSYSNGESTKKIRGQENIEINNENYDNMNIFLYYWKEKWDISISSNLYFANDNENLNSKLQSIEINGTYRVTDELSIAPNFGIIDESYDWNGGGVDYLTRYASLTIAYYQSEGPFGIAIFGYFSDYVGSDTYTDSSTFNGHFQIIWDFGKNSIYDHVLSLELGYNNYLDNFYSASDYHEVNSYLRYKVAMF